MGPPSSGGSTMLEALNILEDYHLGSCRAPGRCTTTSRLRFAYADRNAYLGDPVFVNMPVSGLLAEGSAASGAALIKEKAPTGRAAGRPAALNGEGGSAWGKSATRWTRRARRRTCQWSPQRQRGLLHVHDRADRRQRNGRPRLRVPAQQRVDRLQLRLDVTANRSRREAPAHLDRPDDRHEGPQAVVHDRLAGGATIITTVLQTLINRLDSG